MANPSITIPVDIEANAQFSALLDVSEYDSEEYLLKALIAEAVDKLSDADRKSYYTKAKEFEVMYKKWSQQ